MHVPAIGFKRQPAGIMLLDIGRSGGGNFSDGTGLHPISETR
jgi:hypothetical protein